MHITLDISPDVMATVKDLAERQNQSVENILLDLVRQGMERSAFIAHRNGFPVIVRPGGKPITLERINDLRDDEDERYYTRAKER